MKFSGFSIPGLVLCAVLAASTWGASAAPPEPPPPPRVKLNPPQWIPAFHEWKWELQALDGGIASFHVDVPAGDPKATAFQPEPFEFGLDPGGKGYFWQVPGKTVNDNLHTGPDFFFSFSVRSAGFTGNEKFSYRYDYLWDYEESGNTIVRRTVFQHDANGQAVILQTLPVPEPAGAVLMLGGLAVLGFALRRQGR